MADDPMDDPSEYDEPQKPTRVEIETVLDIDDDVDPDAPLAGS